MPAEFDLIDLKSIDLNADLGESFGAWRLGDDQALFALVSSANVACGFHAGDPVTMLASARLAARHGVALGAHPGYRDLAGFGRRALDTAPAEIAAELLAQLGALDGIARAAGTRVRYVKAHGALYHRLAADESAAHAFVEAVAAFDPALTVLGQPLGAIARAADAAGLRYAREAFVDRGYTADGSLVPRGEPGAVVDDPAAASDRALEIAETGGIAADDGSRVELAADSLCLHGDTTGAVAIARAVRAALERADYTIESFA
ncbi:LamB/YcsF family protein [Agromyces sp. NPDC055520]